MGDSTIDFAMRSLGEGRAREIITEIRKTTTTREDFNFALMQRIRLGMDMPDVTGMGPGAAGASAQAGAFALEDPTKGPTEPPPLPKDLPPLDVQPPPTGAKPSGDVAIPPGAMTAELRAFMTRAGRERTAPAGSSSAVRAAPTVAVGPPANTSGPETRVYTQPTRRK